MKRIAKSVGNEAMSFKHRRFYPDPTMHGDVFDPSEWILAERPVNVICHTPSWTIFQIEFHESAMEVGRASLSDFSSHIVDVCDPRFRPDEETLAALARVSIVAYLVKLGALEVAKIPDQPERARMKNKSPKPN